MHPSRRRPVSSVVTLTSMTPMPKSSGPSCDSHNTPLWTDTAHRAGIGDRTHASGRPEPDATLSGTGSWLELLQRNDQCPIPTQVVERHGPVEIGSGARSVRARNSDPKTDSYSKRSLKWI